MAKIKPQEYRVASEKHFRLLLKATLIYRAQVAAMAERELALLPKGDESFFALKEGDAMLQEAADALRETYVRSIQQHVPSKRSPWNP